FFYTINLIKVAEKPNDNAMRSRLPLRTAYRTTAVENLPREYAGRGNARPWHGHSCHGLLCRIILSNLFEITRFD
ncbi:MAG: hypothetical protein P8182_09080, partial [Deltaproteobacteria bacterium]